MTQCSLFPDDPLVRVTVLSSGSSGNAQMVEFGDKRILVDVGIGRRALTRGLAEVGRQPEDLSAILITHEHRDHVSGIVWLATRLRIPVYATAGTLSGDAGGTLVAIAGRSEIHVVRPGREFAVGDVTVRPFATSHDCSEPCGYRFEALGRAVTVATDLGFVSDGVKEHLREADVLVLEANHDPDMLAAGRYPWFLKKRILGDRGHLSNVDAAKALADVVGTRTRTVVLAHLSADNNRPQLAYNAVARALGAAGCPGDEGVGCPSVHVASRFDITGPFTA